MTEFKVCNRSKIANPGSLEFDLPGSEPARSGFLVQIDGQISAFINSCPHTGASLNWQPHQFLDYEQRLIQCALHGAQFRPSDGLCIWGPCNGQSLQSLAVTIRDEQVYIQYE